MGFHFKIGLKLWSTNTVCAKRSVELYRRGIFDYIELYVVPGSKEMCLDQWKGKKFSYILHAPHSYSGLNLSLRDSECKNRLLIEEVESFRLTLKPAKIIFHPGIQGSIYETTRQILMFKEDYPELFDLAIIENKPRIGIKGEECVGASPEEIKRIIQETGIGFCLDIGHAIYYCAWANLPYEDEIDKFLKLKPDVYHLSDGNTHSQTDMHLNFGAGNFELHRLIKKIPKGACITIETYKDMTMDLRDFESDSIYLKKQLKW